MVSKSFIFLWVFSIFLDVLLQTIQSGWENDVGRFNNNVMKKMK